jgi:hypothetical protein
MGVGSNLCHREQYPTSLNTIPTLYPRRGARCLAPVRREKGSLVLFLTRLAPLKGREQLTMSLGNNIPSALVNAAKVKS